MDAGSLIESLTSDLSECAISTDPDISPEEQAMLEYVGKLTREPWAVGPEDIAALRTAGFEESAILDICQIASYFNFVNRLADGLGVELETER